MTFNLRSTRIEIIAISVQGSAKMFDLNSFEEVFGYENDAFSEDVVMDVEINRKALEGLFIDKALRTMGMKRRKILL